MLEKTMKNISSSGLKVFAEESYVGNSIDDYAFDV